MKFKGHLVRQMDIIDSWDGSPFQDVKEANIDETNHVIHNVCVFGTRFSKNGYTYQDQAIKTLSQLTEGAKLFINHPSKTEEKDRDGVRDIRDWGGIYRSPKQEGDKVYADLFVRPAYWELLRDIAVMQPAGVGNSINSQVKVYKDEKGQEHIIDINKLKSVDVVASAATTINLFESAMEESGADKKEVLSAIESYCDPDESDWDSNSIKAFIIHTLGDFTEGLLTDKINEKAKVRAINSLTWQASDVIEEILRDKEKKFSDKKSEISSVLDDLEAEIGKIMSGKLKPDNKSILFHKQENDEEDEMEFTNLTLEDLQKERPDLVKAIAQNMKDSEEIQSMKTENTDLKKANEDLTKTNGELKAENEKLTKENEDLKKKVDDFETKDKAGKKEALIKEKIIAAKLPKEAVSDIFMSDLMAKDEEQIDAAIKDRLELWGTNSGKPKGAGDEFKNDSKEVKEQKVESAKQNLKDAR